ncbi:acyl-coenzyme A thioesterase 1-like isoform X3 [Engraulis encrasicolus]|uniref:acyl-coenzyme A thioesterase 1-like isoform X3 n=1 Tax=Engraulis encrasicolus TaxID=184585 RepID=UPI002FD41DD4
MFSLLQFACHRNAFPKCTSLACLNSRLCHPSFSAAMSTRGVSVQTLPPAGYFDEPLEVIIRGLCPKQTVRLLAEVTDDKGMKFQSSAVYQASERGEVSTESSPSLGGTYIGVEPTGLLWSLTPASPHNNFTCLDASRPLSVDMKVVSHDEPEDVLAKVTHQRRFMKYGAERRVVTDGRLRGTLFIPPGPGPFPGIVDLYTLRGGPAEPRASLLANKGFVVLALAFFRYKDLPKQVGQLDLEYFEEGVNFLKQQPKVKDGGVGIISISKSGDLALSMAAFLSTVRAAVTINFCCFNVGFPLAYKGTVIPAFLPDPQKIVTTDQGLADISQIMPAPSTKEALASAIPFERATDCHFMFVAAEDDKNWDSVLYAELAAQRLRDHGKGENVEVVRYPRTGHFLDVPHMPFYPSGFHAIAGTVVVFGGEAKANAYAQMDLWERVQKFFRKHLDRSDPSFQARL